MVQVYFIGAGPGDIDLLTIRARKLIRKADIIIYADSLVNPDICSFARKDALIHKSASMTLEETTSLIEDAVKAGQIVARLHSGDPSIYGAIAEQMAMLDRTGIDYEVIPGVSSLFASAALLKVELTAPGIAQTVIITRREGRTPVPTRENLRSLASHGATMAILLSAAQVQEVVDDLIQGGYQTDTPAAVVYRAGWKDGKIIHATLADLADQLTKSGITKHALILVGKALDKRRAISRSKLYDPDFKHDHRK